MDYNHTIILGRVTASPELRATPSGQPVARMGVATNRIWSDKQGQKQEEVEFHNVVLWGKQAEIAASYLQKGSGVLVSGRLKTRSWQDKNGQLHKTTEIVAEHLQLGAKPQAKVEEIRPEPTMTIQGDGETDDINPESIPF